MSNPSPPTPPEVVATPTEVKQPPMTRDCFLELCKRILKRGPKTFYKEWWEGDVEDYIKGKTVYRDTEARVLIHGVELVREEARGWVLMSDSD